MSDYPSCPHDMETLKRLQSLSLRAKVTETRHRIAEWVEYWGKDKCYVSFSGGKDSTVLLDIVRRDYPDILAVFFDTGLEFPEIREFVKTIDNVDWVKPKLTFKQTIDKYGYPLISKKQAQYIGEVQNARTEGIKRLRCLGIRKDGTHSPMSMISKKWQFLAFQNEIKISDKCCKALKTRPAAKYEKDLDMKPIIGVMSDEGGNREKSYERYGCNAYELTWPRSAPMMFWLEADIWEYINTYNLPYSKIYDMGYKRTGCMFCAFGAHLEKSPNRFQLMEKTHPKQYKYCMKNLGMEEVLKKIGVQTKYQPDLFDNIEDNNNDH